MLKFELLFHILHLLMIAWLTRAQAPSNFARAVSEDREWSCVYLPWKIQVNCADALWSGFLFCPVYPGSSCTWAGGLAASLASTSFDRCSAIEVEPCVLSLSLLKRRPLLLQPKKSGRMWRGDFSAAASERSCFPFGATRPSSCPWRRAHLGRPLCL